MPGTLANAAAASRWLDGIANAEALSSETAFALEVCLEELLTNIVRHGTASRHDGSLTAVSLQVAVEPARAFLVVEDDGPEFDLGSAPGRRVDRPLEQLEPGGLGIQLIKSLTSKVTYERLAGKNRVVLEFSRRSEHGSEAAHG